MRPTHVMEDNLLYSTSTDLNVNHVLKSTFRTTRLVFDRTTGHCGLAKLIFQINHHSDLPASVTSTWVRLLLGISFSKETKAIGISSW